MHNVVRVKDRLFNTSYWYQGSLPGSTLLTPWSPNDIQADFTCEQNTTQHGYPWHAQSRLVLKTSTFTQKAFGILAHLEQSTSKLNWNITLHPKLCAQIFPRFEYQTLSKPVLADWGDSEILLPVHQHTEMTKSNFEFFFNLRPNQIRTIRLSSLQRYQILAVAFRCCCGSPWARNLGIRTSSGHSYVRDPNSPLIKTAPEMFPYRALRPFNKSKNPQKHF